MRKREQLKKMLSNKIEYQVWEQFSHVIVIHSQTRNELHWKLRMQFYTQLRKNVYDFISETSHI